ncbi:MAG: urease accessory protein UreE [Acidobacteriota bacterium]|nr:urease accessory protein UreE [Acidobacteriota bacterium]
MLIIDHIPPTLCNEDLAGKEADSLVLTSEQRRWARGRFTSAHGRDIALALPTGEALAPGSVLHLEPQWYLEVRAAAEPVIAILPTGYENAVKIAFEVGNRHFPLALEGEEILVPDDPAMAQLLDRLGAKWERRRAAFSPVGKERRHGHA